MTQIKNVEKRLLDDLRRVAQELDKFSDTELIQIARELDFFQELLDKGYSNAVNGLMEAYESDLSKIKEEATRRGVKQVAGASVAQLQLLQDLEVESLLGKASVYANDLKDGLFKGIISGERPSAIVNRLAETINLETRQLNVAVADGIRQFDDLATQKVFEDIEVRWTYTGPMDERTRDICLDTILNEPPNGYTEAQVRSGKTPFGTRGGINCRHKWNVWESPNKTTEPMQQAKLPKQFKGLRTSDLNKGQLNKYSKLARLRSARKIDNQEWTEGLKRILR